MKFFKKNKICNPKVIVKDFRKLKPGIFEPLYELTKEEMVKEFALCTSDGKLYVNSMAEGHEFFAEIFNILTKEEHSTLEAYMEEYKKKYPHIKNFNDWGSMKCGDKEKTEVFGALAIPLEFTRRSIENRYYNR